MTYTKAMENTRKTVLITGSSRGIGRACAELFASQGYNVVINYLKSHKTAAELQDAIRSQGGNAIALRADVADRAQAEEMCDRAIGEFGTIDVLVNNAGIAQQAVFTDVTQSDWERMLAVNVTGMFNCTQCVLPGMIRRKNGSVVNLSSMWGITGASCEVAYSTSKAAVIGFTKALAKELGPSGIRVNCVAPGVVDTDMNAELTHADIEDLRDKTPLQRIGSAHEIAQCVYFLAQSGSSFITGQVVSPNGGFVM